MQTSKLPLEIFKDAIKYKLIKLDESGNTMFWWLGYHIILIKLDDGKYESHKDLSDFTVGYSLGLDFDGISFKWQTGEIVEVINVSDSEIEFKTVGSHYKLCILNQ